MQFYTLPDNYASEIDDFEKLIENYNKGEVSELQLKIYRVPFGVYEQREKGTFMVRIRCSAGGITPIQLRKVAELSQKYGNKELHVTTRQEVQIHDAKLSDIIAIIRGLKEVELSSRGGGGNTLRNVMASYDSGLQEDDIFDVTPYATLLTDKFIERPDTWKLPRKFKITFSSSLRNNSNVHINDVGFQAMIKDGKRGFKVYVAGGMGAKPKLAEVLEEFVLAEDIFLVAEAVKQVFSKYGNRKNKHIARMRFLWRELGRENFVKYYFEQKAEIEATEGWKIDIKESDLQNKINTEFTLAVEDTNVEGFDQWKRRYVLAQKQENLNSIKVPFLYGLVSNEYLMELADLLMHFGEDTIRFTMQQNIHLRNIPTQYLGNLFKLISKITDLSYKPALIGNVITCTGADTCKLGICLPKGLLGRINDSLNIEQSGLDRLNNFKVNVSGCPNTCGQHMTADLGFFGKIKRNGDHIYPAYNIVAGASEHLDDTSMAIPVDIISSKDLPNFLNLFLAQYLEKMDNYSSFKEYILDGGKEDIIALCDQFRAVPNFDEDKNYYFDWGAKTIFSLEGKGQGECSAGVFDLIKFDLNSAKKLIKNNEYTSDAVLFTARALLVTKGVEARGENEAYEAFEKFFIKRGLVGEEYRDLIKAARAREELVPEDVISFKKTIDVLYNSMSNSLIFAKEKTTKVEKKAKTPLKAVVNKEEAVLKDLRGVKCPINFVKTKIELAKMASGEVLEIYLDHGEPIENVPGSVRMEGHEVISEKNVGDYWSVTIRKA